MQITDTPWGVAQGNDALAPGITFVHTASHGGFHLSAERNALVPIAWRKASFNKRGVDGWYEEDCDWCMVALTFPEYFKAADLVAARGTMQHWIAAKL